MNDNIDSEEQIRKEIRKVQSVLRRVSNEVLVIVPDLLTEEMNKRAQIS